MESDDKTLALFTSQFPYGKVSETFIETEIMYLKDAFSRVIIFPLSKESDFKRELPLNVTVDNCLNTVSFTFWKKLTSLIAHPGLVWATLTSEAKSKGILRLFNHRKVVLDYLSQQINYHTILKEKLTTNMIIYDYWLVDSTLALTFLRRKNKISNLTARGHGFDIYDERNLPLGVLFRDWKMNWIDRLVLISDFGKKYIEKKIDSKHRAKLHVSRLGVHRNTEFKTKNEDIKVIVSCSNLHPFKNVMKIPQVLSYIKSPIKWIHFGDGPEMQNIIECVSKLPENIKVELKGHISNSEVIEFYRSSNVNLFISFSLSEGIPVSMMEALSSGIQILSYPVGGIPELVINDVTGMLMPMEISDPEYAEMIEQLIQQPIEKDRILSFFHDHFDASLNYPKFIDLLCSKDN